MSVQAVRRVTWAGFAVNLGLSILKFICGIFTHSQALVADAVHSLSDLATDLVVIFGVRFWSAPPDDCHPHGHGRIETMTSLTIGLLLMSVGGGLAYNAFTSFQNPQPISAGPVFWVAMIALAVKEILYHWTIRVGRSIRSSAVIANAWHHRSDALSSLPVALSAIAQSIWPGLTLLDPVAAIIVAVFITQASWKIIRPAFAQLLDSGVSEGRRKEFTELALSCENVRSLHKLRTRIIGSGIQVDLHIQVDPEMTVVEGHDVARAVEQAIINSNEDVMDVLVHIEPDMHEKSADAAPKNNFEKTIFKDQ